MLQRSQTLYLLGVLILAILMFTGPFARFMTEGGELVLKHSGLFDTEGNKMELAAWPLTLFFALVAALSFFNIFSYRNRIRQMRLCILLIFLGAGMIGMMFYYTWFAGHSIETTQTLYLWRFVIPPICIIMLYLAFRRIRRDELLVKAFDRIR
jgi:uncharacterized membrane protein YoaK (UPF0700 family)